MHSKIIIFVSKWNILTEINANLFLLFNFSSSAEKGRLLQGAVMSRSLTGDNIGVFNATGNLVDAPLFHPSSQRFASAPEEQVVIKHIKFA